MWNNILIGILLSVHVIVALLMVFVILMQRTKQDGLGAAFGGGFTDSIFGAQTSNILTKATSWFAAIFFILSIVLGYLYSHRNTSTIIEKDLSITPPPAATAPANPTAPIPPVPGAPVVPTAPVPAAPTAPVPQ
jgi:preprotein translocase subunit SecG